MKLGGFRFVVFLALCMGPSSAAPVEGILEQHNVYRCGRVAAVARRLG